jgi:hypothetical protein
LSTQISSRKAQAHRSLIKAITKEHNPTNSGVQLTNFISDRIHSFEVSHDGKQLVFREAQEAATLFYSAE